MKRERRFINDLDSGLDVLLRRGKVKLVPRGEGTPFSVRQASRWLKHHPERKCAAVPIGEGEVAA